VLATLRELGESPVNIEVPDIAGTLEAVRHYKIARDAPAIEAPEPAPPAKPSSTGARVR
jgi:uncharacterized protein HemX